MMIRIFNAKMLTPDGLIDGGELWIEDGKIKLVCPVSPLILLPWDREINAHGNLLMPAFKNAHAHSPMVFLRLAFQTSLSQRRKTRSGRLLLAYETCNTRVFVERYKSCERYVFPSR